MLVIPGHPFDLGDEWDRALGGEIPDWKQIFDGCAATLDWPASMFWRELGEANPEALVLLSVRDSARIWWQSAEATILPVALFRVERGEEGVCRNEQPAAIL